MSHVWLDLVLLDPIELNYYPFIISLDKFNESCNAVDDFSTKICVPNKTKDINVKVFNIITRIYDAKKLVKHIQCDCKCKFNSAICNSNQKWDNNKCQCKCKKYRTCKRDCTWDSSTRICENSK